MIELLSNPIFGLFLTLTIGSFFWWLQSVAKFACISPLLFSITLIIIVLQGFNIPYSAYKQGADIIHSFLGPITVILAIPLYEHRNDLIKHRLAILSGTIVGSLSALVSVVLLGHFFGLSDLFIHSLMPKSVTTPIGISASEILDGIIGLSVVSIIITGLIGSFIASTVFKFFKIKSPIAQGVALGTTSHVIGTGKAYELSRVTGAMSGLSIGLAGIISIIWIVLYATLFM
ncbi:MAG: LrgB family protein [Gammaproteobacteria bacterium]|nr:LrgB family protein [Gammaproteobacteria bacterium]